MEIVLLQTKVEEQELLRLSREFPQIFFLQTTDLLYKSLSPDDWAKVEVLFGNKLKKEELEQATELRWIHCPYPTLNLLCLKEIHEHGNVMITLGEEENYFQVAEYVIAGILAFTKHLFHWERVNLEPNLVWDSKWRDSMETLRGKRLIQVGLGKVGDEIARRAQEMGMEVWGVDDKKSFHPNCKKVVTFHELQAALSKGDVVSVAMPRNDQRYHLIGAKELQAIPEGAIFTFVGMKTVLDEHQLEKTREKFRGVLLDFYYQMPLSPASKLWGMPNVLVTPQVAPRPQDVSAEAMKTFRFNLRQFLHGNFIDMKNVFRYHG